MHMQHHHQHQDPCKQERCPARLTQQQQPPALPSAYLQQLEAWGRNNEVPVLLLNTDATTGKEEWEGRDWRKKTKPLIIECLLTQAEGPSCYSQCLFWEIQIPGSKTEILETEILTTTEGLDEPTCSLWAGVCVCVPWELFCVHMTLCAKRGFPWLSPFFPPSPHIIGGGGGNLMFKNHTHRPVISTSCACASSYCYKLGLDAF